MKEFCAEERITLRTQLEKKINTPLTSCDGTPVRCGGGAGGRAADGQL
ncbi:MAG: hypothetical protein MZV64_60095 [Ignavibacteriales bacterium]|nr:hypothetical protein [Ignavibacteriales bacterium]